SAQQMAAGDSRKHRAPQPVVHAEGCPEAMVRAGVDMRLSEPQAYRLAVATFAGAAELARRSDEPPAVLRQRVTSKGGTTHATQHA
ncbi:hypothetical protein D8B27_22270, partial [Verminephrobacter aporrectodeae subsp. tuberculatae]|nr:hypothetical protein [Verminephrobacter aporrectodeae subsp. tuberculatae]